MTTDKQIEANKQNALSSTGPQSPDGKEISKMNATKHGLLSHEVLLEGEDDDLLVEFGKRLREELKPIGELEQLLTDQIIANTWRLRRVMTVEKAMMEWEREKELTDIFASDKASKQHERKAIRNMIINEDAEKLTRYEASIARGFYRALHELIRVQATRRGERPPIPMAMDIDIEKGE